MKLYNLKHSSFLNKREKSIWQEKNLQNYSKFIAKGEK